MWHVAGVYNLQLAAKTINYVFFFYGALAPVGQGFLIIEDS
jgi:hypothetical protein